MPNAPIAIWFTGLPGCGKSTLARAALGMLEKLGVPARCHSMDERRQAYAAGYDDSGREAAYRLFAEEAAGFVRAGQSVVLDATAPQLAMRAQGRGLVTLAGGRFAEVHARCSLKTAMAREAARPQGKVMAGLYAKAMLRKVTGRQFEGLGPVPGVDVPFEEDPAAELTIGNDGPIESALPTLEEFLRRFTGASAT